MRKTILAYFLFLPLSLYAYLDPGTGSLLVYALVGVVTTVFFALRNFWYSLKGRAFLAGSATAKYRGKLPDAVFHSEGGKYWPVFKPVLAALEAEGVSCAYVTPDAADPGLAHQGKGFTSIRPGGETATIAWMNAAKAGLVVSTTPQLDVYMLRRSHGVQRYAHLFHAPTDIAFYEKYAFDWYDALLTVGPFQEASVRTLERKRSTPTKRLMPTGCTYFDYMLAESGMLGASTGQESKTALYAPTWGVRSSTLRYGADIIEPLTEAGYRVIFRPHPQFYVSHKEMIADLEHRLASNPLVELDRARTGYAAMSRSSFMLTDLSGVLFDYALLFGRPIILAMSDAGAGGQEGEDLSQPLWDVEASVALSFCLMGDDPSALPVLAEQALAARSVQERRIMDFRDRSFYNFGTAGQAAAANIISLMDGR